MQKPNYAFDPNGATLATAIMPGRDVEGEMHTDPNKMTKVQREDFVTTYVHAPNLYTCIHGHIDCSPKLDGPCLDAVLRCQVAKGERE